MGAAWCRDRAAAVNNSKSPLDRVFVQCFNQIYPSAETGAKTVGTDELDIGATRVKPRPAVSYPVPVHTTHRPVRASYALNASSKWEDASLSVPDSPDESVTPIPPPRKKKIWREKQIQQEQQQELWKTVPRPPPPEPPSAEVGLLPVVKKKRRQKTLSSVSLPNYNDLSLSVYTPGNNDKSAACQKIAPRNESCMSLPGKNVGLGSLSGATVGEKIENCVRRCRSFGAFKPEPLKIKSSPVNGRLSSESDDSFDGLDDWDLRVIEHCDAHEVSPPSTLLPPQRLRRAPQQVLVEKNRYECAKDEGMKYSSAVKANGSAIPVKDSIASESNPETSVKNSMSVLPQKEIMTREVKEALPELEIPVKESTAKESLTESPVWESLSGCSLKESLEGILENLSAPGTPVRILESESQKKESIFDIPLKPFTLDSTKMNFETEHTQKEVESETENKKTIVYDFLSSKKSPEEAKQSLVNGYHREESPTGLKTPPPTPENKKSKGAESWVEDDHTTHSSLLRLLKEYQNTDGKMEDSGAQQVLKDLGLPPSLHDQVQKGSCASRGSSGRSSMTPSLSELEAALSDLLEASATKDEEDDITTPVTLATTTPPVSLTNMRVISPKPFTAFSSTFHPVQSTQGGQETTA